MILRLIIAFTRWVWGVSPAFITAESADWYIAMFFGAIIDIGAVGVLTIVLIDWWECGRSK